MKRSTLKTLYSAHDELLFIDEPHDEQEHDVVCGKQLDSMFLNLPTIVVCFAEMKQRRCRHV